MKIVLDNIVFSLQKAGGISVVWFNVLKRLLSIQKDNLTILEYTDSGNNIFRNKLEIPEKFVEKRSTKFMGIKRYLSPKVNINEKFIFHSSYYRICKNKNAINITTVHDFTYEYFVSGLKKKVHVWQKNKAIRNSDYVICISENTRQDLFKFLPDIKKDKVRIIYNGVSDDYHHMNEVPYPEYKNYILFIGSRDSYKNFSFVVDAIKDTSFNLLICGRPLNSEEVSMVVEKLGDNRYKVISGISNEKLNKFYNSVFCLAYPSSYEGFGIPVLEAQKAGCPVIAYNSSSIPEIIGDSYPLLKSICIEDFHKMLEMFRNQILRENIIKYGLQNSNRFSWDKMSSEYIDLYDEIARNNQIK